MVKGGSRKGRGKDQVREDKVNQGIREIKEKFMEQRKIIPLQAKTDNQRLALKAFTEHQCVILTNHSGVGKSELMTWWACKQWLEGSVDNIIITRPYKHIGADYGATKGNDAEKLLPFCMSMLMKMKKYLGVGIMKNNFKLDGFESFFSDLVEIFLRSPLIFLILSMVRFLLCTDLCTMFRVFSFFGVP